MRSKFLAILSLVLIATSVAACSQISADATQQHLDYLQNKPGPR